MIIIEISRHTLRQALTLYWPRNQYASLLQTHQTLRSEYQKLLSVTSELTAGLETVAQTRLGNSQQIDWKNVKIKI